MSVFEQVFVSLFVLLVGGVPAGVLGAGAVVNRDDSAAALMMLWGCAVLVLSCAGFLIEVWQ